MLEVSGINLLYYKAKMVQELFLYRFIMNPVQKAKIKYLQSYNLQIIIKLSNVFKKLLTPWLTDGLTRLLGNALTFLNKTIYYILRINHTATLSYSIPVHHPFADFAFFSA